MSKAVPRILFISLLLLVAVTPAFAQSSCNSCSTTTCPTVNLAVTFPNSSTISVAVPIFTQAGTTNTVRQVMDNASGVSSGFTFATTNFCPYGAFVTVINHVPPTGSFWQLNINGQEVTCGLDTCAVSPGDVVTWFVPASTSHATADASAASTSQSHQALMYRSGARERKAKE